MYALSIYLLRNYSKKFEKKINGVVILRISGKAVFFSIELFWSKGNVFNISKIRFLETALYLVFLVPSSKIKRKYP